MPQESAVNTIDEFITQLRLGIGKVRHKRLLWPVLAAWRHERARQATGDLGSPRYFHDLALYRAVALLVAHWILRRLEVKVKAGKRVSRDAWAASQYLLAAVDDFQIGIDQMKRHWPYPKIFNSALAERLVELFADVTPEYATTLASDLAYSIMKAPLLTKDQNAA